MQSEIVQSHNKTDTHTGLQVLLFTSNVQSYDKPCGVAFVAFLIINYGTFKQRLTILLGENSEKFNSKRIYFK